jgi:hypothetical protein
LDGIHGTGELDQETVARGAHDISPKTQDRRFDDFGTELLEPGESCSFINRHES